DDARHLGANLLDRDVERLQNACGETLFLAQQAQQDVLGADVVVLERARLVLREYDDLTSPFSESLEHCLTSLPPLAAVQTVSFLSRGANGTRRTGVVAVGAWKDYRWKGGRIKRRL